jgi:hypothetical protein
MLHNEKDDENEGGRETIEKMREDRERRRERDRRETRESASGSSEAFLLPAIFSCRESH